VNIARFFFHGVPELTSGKNWVIANSSMYTEKRYVIELSTTVNDSPLVIGRIVPHYISWGKGHKPLGLKKVFWIGCEARGSGKMGGDPPIQQGCTTKDGSTTRQGAFMNGMVCVG